MFWFPYSFGKCVFDRFASVAISIYFTNLCAALSLTKNNKKYFCPRSLGCILPPCKQDHISPPSLLRSKQTAQQIGVEAVPAAITVFSRSGPRHEVKGSHKVSKYSY